MARSNLLLWFGLETQIFGTLQVLDILFRELCGRLPARFLRLGVVEVRLLARLRHADLPSLRDTCEHGLDILRYAAGRTISVRRCEVSRSKCRSLLSPTVRPWRLTKSQHKADDKLHFSQHIEHVKRKKLIIVEMRAQLCGVRVGHYSAYKYFRW